MFDGRYKQMLNQLTEEGKLYSQNASAKLNNKVIRASSTSSLSAKRSEADTVNELSVIRFY